MVRREEYEKLCYNHQATMSAPEVREPLPEPEIPPVEESPMPKAAEPQAGYREQPAAPKRSEPQKPAAPAPKAPKKPTSSGGERVPGGLSFKPSAPAVKPAAAPSSVPAAAPAAPVKPQPPAADPQKEREEKINRLLQTVKVGATVSHKKFGTGKITSINSKMTLLRVQFKEGEKSFVFPDAFLNGFLTQE